MEIGSLLIGDSRNLPNDSLINESFGEPDNESLDEQEVLQEGVVLEKNQIDLGKLTIKKEK